MPLSPTASTSASVTWRIRYIQEISSEEISEGIDVYVGLPINGGTPEMSTCR